MKIDSTIQFPGDSQPERVKDARSGAATKGPSGARDVSAPGAEDTVSLSGRHGEVRNLASRLVQVPEVRADRVSALQQQVQTGNFRPDSEKVADAMIAEHRKFNGHA
jgi:negative regulator of flagellin synthesis FlgM